MTARGVKELQAALPNCKVDWNDSPLDPDRRTAEWVLSIGGNIQIRQGGNIETGKDVPSGPVQVTLISLIGYQGETDAGLAYFKGLTHLTAVPGPIAGERCGRCDLANCSNLIVLALDSTKVSDAGLAVLRKFPKLQTLSLHNTRVTDAALADITQCKNLSEIDLSLTEITDAGLAKLEALTNLQHVQVYQTKVSEEGVRKLAAALPRCRIRWDGGTIEPKMAADPDRRGPVGRCRSAAASRWMAGRSPENKGGIAQEPFRLTTVGLPWNQKLPKGLGQPRGLPAHYQCRASLHPGHRRRHRVFQGLQGARPPQPGGLQGDGRGPGRLQGPSGVAKPSTSGTTA